MGYNFIYLLCVLVLFMLALRLFLPILMILIVIGVIIWFVRKFLISHHKHTYQDEDDRSYYESIYQEHQNPSEDIIDVDYKVVDEQENPHQQS